MHAVLVYGHRTYVYRRFSESLTSCRLDLQQHPCTEDGFSVTQLNGIPLLVTRLSQRLVENGLISDRWVSLSELFWT